MSEQTLITDRDLISIGLLKRTKYRDLPEFIFVKRDGLFAGTNG